MQNKTGFAVALMFTLLCSGFATAQDKKPLTLEQLDKLQNLDDALNALDKMKALMEVQTREKRSQCQRAFGHPAFCDCLVQNLPIGASFAGYVQIVISSKEQLEYSKLSTDEKSVVDQALKAREVCVAKLGVQ